MNFYKNCFIICRCILKNMKIRKETINLKPLKAELWLIHVTGEFFLKNYWFFDVSCKLNGIINNQKMYPIFFDIAISLPLPLKGMNWLAKAKMLLYCSWILKFFSLQWTIVERRIIKTIQLVQSTVKKDLIFIVKSFNFKTSSFSRFFYYLFTIFPYMWITYENERSRILTTFDGNLNFTVNDITFFLELLNEKHSTWSKDFFFSFSWHYNLMGFNYKNWKFFNLFLIWGMINWLLWSSLGLTCYRGHGGWVEHAHITNVVLNYWNVYFNNFFWY
jgi:hypothetical protein